MTQTKTAFLETLARQPLVFDGGMGTQLIAAGLTTSDCAVEWCRSHAPVVQAVHRAYAEAGCRVLTTNTFQGSRTALAMHGLADAVAELNTAAAKLARQVADDFDGVWVAGDVGPFGGFLEPLGDTTADELNAIFTEQLTALHAGGASVALIETMSDPTEVAVAIAAAKGVADWPVVTTFAFQLAGDTFSTMMGTTAQQAMRQAIDAGADVVGANCGTDLTLEHYKQLGAALVAAAGDVPVIVQPNAGAPRIEDGESIYDATPDEVAAAAAALVDAGVRIVGGCCGTEPAHLAAMARAIKERSS